MHFLQAINSDLSVLIDCNKTGGTIKGDIKKKKEREKVRLPLQGQIRKALQRRNCRGKSAQNVTLESKLLRSFIL